MQLELDCSAQLLLLYSIILCIPTQKSHLLQWDLLLGVYRISTLILEDSGYVKSLSRLYRHIFNLEAGHVLEQKSEQIGFCFLSLWWEWYMNSKTFFVCLANGWVSSVSSNHLWLLFLHPLVQAALRLIFMWNCSECLLSAFTDTELHNLSSILGWVEVVLKNKIVF